MSNLYNTIEELCNSRGISVSQMSNEIGIHRNVMPRLKSSNGKKSLSVATLEKISAYFNVPIDDLLYPGAPSESDIPPEPAITDDQLMFALWGQNPNNMTEEDLERVRSFARYIEQEKKGE